MHDSPAPSWWAFMTALLLLCAVAATLLYRGEQQRLRIVRDECVAVATTDAEKATCVEEYEAHSGWF